MLNNTRQLIITSVIGLSVLLVGTITFRGVEAWRSYRQASDVQAFNTGANQFIAGLFEVLMERLATNNALQAADPAAPAVLAEIELRRKAVRENFGAGLATLAKNEFPGRDAHLRDLNTALEKATTLRQQADNAVKLPRDQRDEVLRKTFVPVITESVNAALKVWFSALHSSASTDPALARLATVKELGWRMRDIAGFERSNLSQSITGAVAITPELLAANAGVRARVDLLWQQLANLTPDGAATHPAISRAKAAAQSQYFGGFWPLADSVKQSSDAGTPYALTTKQWVETTTPQLGALLGVLYAANEASEAHVTAMLSAEQTNLVVSCALLLLSLCGAGVCLWLVVERVARPLGALSSAVQTLAAGDLSVTIPGSEKQDELGAMARSVQVFKDELIAKQAIDRATADESVGRMERTERLEALTRTFEATVSKLTEGLSDAASEMETTAQTMSQTAATATQQTTRAALAAQQTSSNVETVAAATEEMSASVHEITDQVNRSSTIAQQAAEDAKRTDGIVQGLADGAEKIGTVVSMIASIAQQTNLLALNATIEAARAGEAGRGFAVVASEVKALAGQTAQATSEISNQVASIQGQTRQAVEAIQAIAHTISEMSRIGTSVAAAMEEQGAATQEIVRNVSQAAQATQAVTLGVSEVCQGAGDTEQASTQVLGAAHELSRYSMELGREVQEFLASVKAA